MRKTETGLAEELAVKPLNKRVLHVAEAYKQCS